MQSKVTIDDDMVKAVEYPRSSKDLDSYNSTTPHCLGHFWAASRMDRKLELLELAVIWDQGQARDNE